MELSKAEKDKVLLDIWESRDGIYGMIKNGYFGNDEKPVKPNKPRLHTGHTSSQALDYAEEFVAYEQKLPDYEAAMRKYRKNNALKHELFKFAAMWEYDLCKLKNPAYDKCFSLAWDRGHSYGLYEVYNCLADIADLTLTIVKQYDPEFNVYLKLK